MKRIRPSPDPTPDGTIETPLPGETGSLTAPHDVLLMTSNASLVLPFLRDRALHRRLGIEIRRAVLQSDSIRPLDRMRHLHRGLRQRARIHGIPLAVQALHHFTTRGFWRRVSLGAQSADAAFVLHRDLEVHPVATFNDPRLVALTQNHSPRLGIVIGGNQFSRRTLEAIEIPLFNVHIGDPRLVRGQPPIFWDIYENRDQTCLTLHRVTPDLDAGPILYQRAMRIPWRSTLQATLTEGRRRLAREIPLLLDEGLQRILTRTAVEKNEPSGPLRTFPTIGQLARARRICRRRIAPEARRKAATPYLPAGDDPSTGSPCVTGTEHRERGT